MDQKAVPGVSLEGWTIVFDLDGTLVESAPDLLNALNHTIGQQGLAPVDLNDIRSMIGHGAKAMISHAFARSGRSIGGTDLDAFWTVFLDHYRANIAVDSFIFEGVEPALQALSSHGATLSVCTNKTQALSELLLHELEILGHFSSVVGADSVPAKKPHGDHILAAIDLAKGTRDRAIMVGDSKTDEKAALNAGLPFIFVPFGYEAAPMEDIEHAGVLHHYSELLGRVLALAG